MHRLPIKPLSNNDTWQGRRFKTKAYKAYEFELLHTLPKLDIPKGIKLELHINVGFSSKGSDLDNVLKPFLDCLSKKYKFNDNRIYRLELNKNIVSKGFEYIEFNIMEHVL